MNWPREVKEKFGDVGYDPAFLQDIPYNASGVPLLNR